MNDREVSLQKRVRAVILLASVIVLFVTAAAFVAYEAISFRARLVRNLSTLAAVIADNSAAALAFPIALSSRVEKNTRFGLGDVVPVVSNAVSARPVRNASGPCDRRSSPVV